MNIVNLINATATIGLQLHSQQSLQLGAVPFRSLGDLRARHGDDADSIFQLGSA
ncbi:hypothetical protein D3C71_2161440 [compost metagenome]